MARSPNQKLKLLYLMQQLLEKSDENHVLTVQEMACKELERVYIPDTVTSFGMSTQRDGVPHLDYTIFDQCRRVHVYCRPVSAAHLLLRRTRINHSLLVSWPETEPLD